MGVLGCASVLSLVALADVLESKLTAIGTDTVGESSTISPLPVDLGSRRASGLTDNRNGRSLFGVDDLWGSADRRAGWLV